MFRWQLLPGSDGAALVVCSDRDCRTEIARAVYRGSSATLSRDLDPGVYFWHLQGTSEGVSGADSVTWQFEVRAQARPSVHASSWGASPDFNGDGFSDLVAGSRVSSTATILPGSATGPETTHRVEVTPDPAGYVFPASLGAAGDLDGDGFADLWIESETIGTEHDPLRTSLAFYRGSRTGLLRSSEPPIQTVGDDHFFIAPHKIGGGGDLNGDGFSDLAIGDANWQQGRGRVSVYYGSRGGLRAGPELSLDDPATTIDGFGSDVGINGDLNGDEYSDLVVGSTRMSSDGESRIIVYYGGPDGIAADRPTVIRSPLGSSTLLGTDDHIDSDVNGDGFSDLLALVSAPFERQLLVYLGGSHGVATDPDAALMLQTTDVALPGSIVATGGDINGDGTDDVAIATRWGIPTTVQLEIFAGSVTGLSSTPTWSLESPEDERFADAVRLADDFDRDGYSDLAVDSADGVLVYRGATGGVDATRTLTRPAGLAPIEFIR